MSTKPGTKVTWTIHTIGGPIHRIFTSLVNAKAWARKQWTEHKLVIGPDDSEGPASHVIRYAGGSRYDRRPFATIAQRKHCEACGHVIATRSDVHGEWSTQQADFCVPRDFEEHPNLEDP